MFKQVILGLSILFVITGCDNTFSLKQNQEYELVKTKTFPYLINKNTGELFVIKDTNKIKVTDGISKNKILTSTGTETNTKIDIKCKLYDDVIFYSLTLTFMPANNSNLTFKQWENEIESTRKYYKITPYFLDKDNMELKKYQISLKNNLSYHTQNAIVYNGAIGGDNLFSKLLNQSYIKNITRMSFAYILPTFDKYRKKKTR